MKILHIEDSENDRDLCETLIKRTRHWQYFGATLPQDGKQQYEEHHHQVALVDVAFPGIPSAHSYDLMRFLSVAGCCVIALSGDNSQEAVDRARDAGAIAFINKGCLTNPSLFHAAILHAVEKHLVRSTGSHDPESLLRQLAEAVFYGNGRPSVVAQLEAGATRMSDMEEDLKDIKKTVEDSRSETRLRGFAIILLLFLNFALEVYRIHESPKEAARPLQLQLPD